jgi:hypothetical protein
MKGRDNLGHFIGALVIGNEQVLQSAVDSYVSGLGPSPPHTNTRPKTQRPPLSLPKLPSLTPPKVKLPPLPKVQIPKVQIPKLDPKKLEQIPKALGDKLKGLIGGGGSTARQQPQQQSSGSDALRLFDYLFGS